MKDAFLVVAIHSQDTFSPMGSAQRTISITGLREVESAIEEPPSIGELMKQRLEKAHDSKEMDDDTYKVVKKSAVPLMAMFADMPTSMGGQSGSKRRLTVTFDVTEEEYAELGRPAYGDWIELEVEKGQIPPSPRMRFVVKGPPLPAGVLNITKEEFKALARLPLSRRGKVVVEMMQKKLGDVSFSRDQLLWVLKSTGMSDAAAAACEKGLQYEGDIWETKPGFYRRVKSP